MYAVEVFLISSDAPLKYIDGDGYWSFIRITGRTRNVSVLTHGRTKPLQMRTFIFEKLTFDGDPVPTSIEFVLEEGARVRDRCWRVSA